MELFRNVLTAVLCIYVIVFYLVVLYRKIKGFGNNKTLLIVHFILAIIASYMFGHLIGTYY